VEDAECEFLACFLFLVIRLGRRVGRTVEEKWEDKRDGVERGGG
jgi:hypothetical protein